MSYDIGFADGKVVGYSKEETDLHVLVKTWNEVSLEIAFSEVEGVLDVGVGGISDLVVESAATTFVNTVLQRLYERMPESHPYLYYQFLDIEEQPALEIIATGVSITKVEQFSVDPPRLEVS